MQSKDFEVDSKIRSNKNIIAELNALAETNIPIVRDSQAIAVLYKSADNLLQQAIVAHKSGNLEKAYVLYLRFTNFVLSRLPAHISYNHNCNIDDKATYRAKCVKVVKELENLQAQICLQYGYPLKQKDEQKVQPSVKVHQPAQQYVVAPSAPPADPREILYHPLPPQQQQQQQQYFQQVPVDSIKRQQPRVLPLYSTFPPTPIPQNNQGCIKCQVNNSLIDEWEFL